MRRRYDADQVFVTNESARMSGSRPIANLTGLQEIEMEMEMESRTNIPQQQDIAEGIQLAWQQLSEGLFIR